MVKYDFKDKDYNFGYLFNNSSLSDVKISSSDGRMVLYFPIKHSP